MKQLLTVFSIFFSLFLHAQTPIVFLSGRVIDNRDSTPLVFATVACMAGGAKANTGVFTDVNGQFSLPVPATFQNKKNVTVSFSAIGYVSVTYNFSSTESKSGLVIMMQRQVPNDPGLVLRVYPDQHVPVEVRAVRAGALAPFTKTTITNKQIENNNLGQDIPFLLNQTPSAVIHSDAGNGIGYTGIRIRGTDATRINMTINGVPYNDAESQGLFFVNLPDFMSSVETVQIQRGVGSSTNGAGAFGGSMSFSTNNRNQDPYAELNNSYGSFNSRKHTLKLGTGRQNGFFMNARLSHISSDGFIERAKTQLSSYLINAGWANERSSLQFNLISGKEKTYQAWYGIPESKLKTDRRYNAAGTEKPGSAYDNEIDNYRQDHYQLLYNHTFNNSWKMNLTHFFTKGKGYYEQYKADQKFSNYGLANPVINGSPVTETDLVRRLWLDNEFYGQNFSLLNSNENRVFIFGTAWSRYAGRHIGTIAWAQYGVDKDYEWYRYPAGKTDVNSFIKWQQQRFKKINLYADVQYRHVNYSIAGFRNNPAVNVRQRYNFINPKIGARYSHQYWQASLSYAMANKEPNRDDFEAGLNQQPKHETLHDVELNVSRIFRGYYGAVNLSATVYYMQYRNQLIVTGRINDVGAYTRQNVPNSYRAGVELQFAKKWSEWLQTDANLAFSTNKVKSFTEFVDDYDAGGQKTVEHRNTTIALSPATVGNLSFTLIPSKNWQIRLLEKYVSRQYLDNTENSNRVLRSYFVQDAVVDYTLKPKNGLSECRFFLQVNNVFNRKYEPNGYTFSYISGGALSTENYYFPMAGINAMVGVNIKL
jgi:iron complex outermembrane recepter protein